MKSQSPRRMLDESELPDYEERRIIQEDLDSNVVVVASAGTGKTESLVRRMVAGVVAGKYEVESLVAITFTRMAAGELRARFAERLRDAAADSQNARDALRRIDRAFVGTIHAFCARMLRERPLDVGLRPDFTEVDEYDVKLLWRHFWLEELQRRFAEGDTRIDRLAELGIDTRDLYDFFVTRSENSDLELAAGRTEEPDLDHPLQMVEERVDRVMELLGGAVPDERDTFLDQLDLANHLKLHRGVRDMADRAGLLRIYGRGMRKIVLRDWPKRAVAKRVKDEIVAGLVEDVIKPALTLWRQYVYGIVAPLIDDVVERFAEYRRANGLVTFHDLLILSTRLLKDSVSARRFFQAKYRVFFVDEFQDTDPLQAAIISYLVGADVTERDWSRLDPLPGRLFVVGDEKQSIYRFRRADIEVFRNVRDRITKSGGRLVTLRASFRSLPGVCEWVNGAFADLFGATEEAWQAAYDGLSSARIDDDPGIAVTKITTEPVAGHAEGRIVEAEAERIADLIDAQLGGENPAASPGDFMVLTRRKKHLKTYVAALEARGIPYDIVGGDSLSSSEELASLVNMLEALRRPDDEVAFLAYLRGSLVGLGDDELYAWHEAGGRFGSMAKIPPALAEPVATKIGAALETLEASRTDLIALPVATAVERIMERTGLMSFAAGLEGGSTRVGNLLRALSLIRRWESEGMTWSQVVTELRAVMSDPNYNYEQMTLDVGRSDVVRVMNLHQAKGLEAKVVILADAHQKSGHGIDRHVSRAADEDVLSMTVSLGREIVAEPVGWADHESREALFRQAEDLRIAYVAATRARDRLVVCRYAGSKRGPWLALSPYLKTVPEAVTEAARRSPSPPMEFLNPADRVATVRQQLAALSDTSFTIRTVTGEDPVAALGEAPVPGRGADFGTLVHRVLEDIINGAAPDDRRRWLGHVASEAGLGGHAVELMDEVDAFLRSELWTELQAASEVYSEVPFGLVTEFGEEGVRGTIDLVARTESGWTIVDFKTHRVWTRRDAEALGDRYAGQLREYASAWSELTGDPVVRAGLWLTAAHVFLPVAL